MELFVKYERKYYSTMENGELKMKTKRKKGVLRLFYG